MKINDILTESHDEISPRDANIRELESRGWREEEIGFYVHPDFDPYFLDFNSTEQDDESIVMVENGTSEPWDVVFSVDELYQKYGPNSKGKNALKEGVNVSDEKFLEILKNAKLGYDFDDDYSEKRVPLGKAAFLYDGFPALSSEYEHTASIIDYYGEFRDGLPYISNDLEKLAKQYNRYIEWLNPGAIAFYSN